MFTGIVQAVGTVRAVRRTGAETRVTIAATGDFAGLLVGESICVNGVCLTAVAADASGFEADVSAATASCSTLGALRDGSRVNLERSLRATDRLGGHLVSGHVDGIGRIAKLVEVGGSMQLEVAAPAALSRYICPKGSICMDGVSLTVNEVAGANFSVNLIPHTRERTIMAGYAAGTEVNLEVDLIARYLEGLVRARS
jgi:riboflavin synthase